MLKITNSYLNLKANHPNNSIIKNHYFYFSLYRNTIIIDIWVNPNHFSNKEKLTANIWRNSTGLNLNIKYHGDEIQTESFALELIII